MGPTPTDRIFFLPNQTKGNSLLDACILLKFIKVLVTGHYITLFLNAQIMQNWIRQIFVIRPIETVLIYINIIDNIYDGLHIAKGSDELMCIYSIMNILSIEQGCSTIY